MSKQHFDLSPQQRGTLTQLVGSQYGEILQEAKQQYYSLVCHRAMNTEDSDMTEREKHKWQGAKEFLDILWRSRQRTVPDQKEEEREVDNTGKRTI